MHRRSLLIAPLLTPFLSLPGHAGPSPAWTLWRDRFVAADGRVQDDLQGISHSEGQGYGLLLAQAYGDRDAFDRIEDWAQRHLAIRQDRLMGWKWEPGQGVTDWHNATDGDLFRAWAHLRAARDSGWAGSKGRGEAIARDIAVLCLVADPRAPDERLLSPGAELQDTPGRVLVNPSYILPRALRELGEAAAIDALIRTADHGTTLLAELAQAGPMPDWVRVTEAGFEAPEAYPTGSSYDAIRVPLYLCWSGLPAHPAVQQALRGLTADTAPDEIAIDRARDGSLRGTSTDPGYRAIAELAAGRRINADAQAIAAQPYYPATLLLLAQVAQAEAGA